MVNPRHVRRSAWRTVVFPACAILLIASACGETPVIWDGNRPLVGAWNGMHASLRLVPTSGEIEYDCAHGGLSVAIRPDVAGQFVVPGVHVPEHGGPIREGEVPDSLPALYFGTVRGEELTLRVAVGSDTLGPFLLRPNAPGRLLKCL